MLEQLYGPHLSLLTDLYQLTMAYAAWKSGAHRREAVFHQFFRKAPFGGGFTIAAGLGTALEYLRLFRFQDDDLAYLAAQRLFDDGFLDYLKALRLTCDVDAVPEGTAVFPQQPLLRVQGPIIPCMLLETPLLALLNFQTLIATKAARVCLAAQGDPVLEFGLRRAQGIDGALLASRAAFIGGVESTSNALAGKLLGIPARGTHAHSWVMLFDSELEAFREYARALPDNCLLLVDTTDSLRGVAHAIEVGRELRARGHELRGVRLDSGDLAWLSIEARRMLDEAGFPNAVVLASNDLDERVIESLKAQGARIAAWGVGTQLVTGGSESALGGVYKLGATREPGGAWQPRIKLAEQGGKITTPGILQVRRFVRGELAGDCVYDLELGPGDGTFIDPLDPTRRKALPAGTPFEDLLVPVVRAGEQVYAEPPLAESRERTRRQLALLSPASRRFTNPHVYPVGLEPRLHERRVRMILEARA